MADIQHNGFRDLSHVVKFNGDNYNEYKYELLSTLEQLGLKNMLEPVNGILNTCPEPIPAEGAHQQGDEQVDNPIILAPANELEIDAWRLRDVTCRNSILATNEPMQKQALYGCETAREMWMKLRTQYVARADDLEHTYHQQLCDIKHDPGKDIRFHINKFCNIANKLREMGSPLPANLLISKIICSLPEPYKEFRARWRDVPTPEKTIDNMTMRLIGEEGIIACYKPTSSNNNAFQASDRRNQYHNDPSHKGGGHSSMRGVKNGRVNDQRRQKPSRHHSGTNDDTKTWKCLYCEVDTHETKNCRKMFKARELANEHFGKKMASEK